VITPHENWKPPRLTSQETIESAMMMADKFNGCTNSHVVIATHRLIANLPDHEALQLFPAAHDKAI